MPRTLDLDRWPRRQHFELFRHYEQPFWSLCAEVDGTDLLAVCRTAGGPSFFLASLYLSLAAVNAVPELRCRIRGEEVVVHEVVHGGSTVLRGDDTFAFAYFDFREPFAAFAAAAGAEIERVKAGPPRLEPRPERDDLVYYSVIPWVSFTSFSHARRRPAGDSVPRIVFGKLREDGDRYLLPVSIEVHHALVDGLHVGRFFERFAAGLAAPDLR